MSTRTLSLVAVAAIALTIGACSSDAPKERETAPAQTPGESTSEESAEPTGNTSTTDRQIPEGGMEIDVFTLRVGDCIDTAAVPDADEIDSIWIVNCSEEHDAEVFYAHTMDGEPGAEFPGDEAVFDEAQEACLGTAFESWVGTPYVDSTIWASPLYPVEYSWDSLDDREILCIAISPDLLTGTLQGSNL